MFWEEWKSITAERQSERIVPLIHGMVALRPDLVVMQDNIPYQAIQTAPEFGERGVFLLSGHHTLPNRTRLELDEELQLSQVSRLEGRADISVAAPNNGSV